LPLPWDFGLDELPSVSSLGLARPSLVGAGA
jgi:hypothetical protein